MKSYSFAAMRSKASVDKTVSRRRRANVKEVGVQRSRRRKGSKMEVKKG